MDDLKTGRGYDLPITKERWTFWLFLAVSLFLSVMIELDLREYDYEEQWVLRILYPVLLLILTVEFVRCFGKMHLVSQGIAVTLFGRTIRRFPREDIRFLGGVQYSYKGRVHNWICVCAHTMEELAEEQERKTPKMFRNARTRPRWAEDMAGKLLYRYVGSTRFSMGFRRKDILTVEWSLLHLSLLQEMYPEAPWVDLTDKKILDAERNL